MAATPLSLLAFYIRHQQQRTSRGAGPHTYKQAAPCVSKQAGSSLPPPSF